jgi:hypothetical protein
MAKTPRSAESLEDKANRLYWHSPDTIEALVNQLSITRNALYSAVSPLPVGTSCPECEEDLVFLNRSQRLSRRAACPACEERFDLDELEADAETGRSAEPDAAAERGERSIAAARTERWRAELAAVTPGRVLMIGGAALAGLVLGAVAVRAARRR